jgi:hypothetical protein
MLLECAQEIKQKELPQQYDKGWDVYQLVKMQHVEDAEEEIIAFEVLDDNMKMERRRNGITRVFSRLIPTFTITRKSSMYPANASKRRLRSTPKRGCQ